MVRHAIELLIISTENILMKVALILPTNPWYCPFVNIYTDIFDSIGQPYDVIYWNRFNEPNNSTLIYNAKLGANNESNRFFRLAGYINYSKFIIKLLKRDNYSKIIVFGPQIGLFCQPFLSKHFKHKFIFDYRDLSIEQNPIFQNRLKNLLDDSFANVISSPGFKRCLPKQKYYISHNFIIDEVRKGLIEHNCTIKSDIIEVLTIGGIRVDANPEIIDALGNKPNIHLSFVGRGIGVSVLKEQAEINNYTNIDFEGFYEKKDEPQIIQKASFLNIFYPHWLSHETALSNRFYNSLIYRRPMIVTRGQIQGDFCEQFNVGLAISDCENLDEKLREWINNTDFKEYQKNCINLLNIFLKDYNNFKDMVSNFCIS